MSDELLPCPFCGGDVTFEDDKQSPYIWCDRCDNPFGLFHDKHEALVIWNRRAVPTPQAVPDAEVRATIKAAITYVGHMAAINGVSTPDLKRRNTAVREWLDGLAKE